MASETAIMFNGSVGLKAAREDRVGMESKSVTVTPTVMTEDDHACNNGSYLVFLQEISCTDWTPDK